MFTGREQVNISGTSFEFEINDRFFSHGVTSTPATPPLLPHPNFGTTGQTPTSWAVGLDSWSITLAQMVVLLISIRQIPESNAGQGSGYPD